MTQPPDDDRLLECRVGPLQAPGRLDVWLAAQWPELSRSRWKQLIEAGRVEIDGQAAKARHRLTGGERVRALLPPEPDPEPQPEALPLDILYEDAELVVVNKAPGMVVHPGAGCRSGTLVNALLARYGPEGLSRVGGPRRPGIVHRLDRLTSGCLAVARSDRAHRALAAQLSDRSMSRRYLCWVLGIPGEAEGLIDAPIGRSRSNRTRMCVGGLQARPARTHWRRLSWGAGLARLECRLETGRTHQIRVHLAQSGHPVLGDPDYGPPAREARQALPPGHPRVVQALARLERQLLHAHILSLIHPATGQPLETRAPLPEDFLAFDQALAPHLEAPLGP